MSIAIREAVLADAPAIAAVKRAAALRAYGTFATDADLATWLGRRADCDFIAGRIHDQGHDSRFVVATVDGRVVGAGLIRAEGAGGYLADVYCDPPGHGAGTAVVESLLRFAADRGWDRIRCFALADNTAAVRFFTSFGFRATGRQPNSEMSGDLLELTR